MITLSEQEALAYLDYLNKIRTRDSRMAKIGSLIQALNEEEEETLSTTEIVKLRELETKEMSKALALSKDIDSERPQSEVVIKEVPNPFNKKEQQEPETPTKKSRGTYYKHQWKQTEINAILIAFEPKTDPSRKEFSYIQKKISNKVRPETLLRQIEKLGGYVDEQGIVRKRND